MCNTPLSSLRCFLIPALYLSLVGARGLPPSFQSAHQSRTCMNQPRPTSCGDFCSFRVCNEESQVLPTAPFVVLLDRSQASNNRFICSTEDEIVSVSETGEARVFDTDHFVPISKWRPSGLNTPFRSDTFISRVVPGFNTPGFGRGPLSRGNQWSFLHDQCVILPILRYGVRSGRRTVARDSVGDLNSCVAFRTTAPAVHIRAEWENSDDFDVLVRPPDGNVIDFNNPTTQCGRLLPGFFSSCAADLPVSSEDIVFLPGNDLPGRYRGELRHFESCSRELVRWTFQFIRNGNTRLSITSRSRRGNNALLRVSSIQV